MFVCICHAISEQDLQNFWQQGICDLKEIQRLCGAGSDCGTCLQQIHSQLEKQSKRVSTPPAAR